jgi:hypothetical protein
MVHSIRQEIWVLTPAYSVWKENDNVAHSRFYWLERAPETARPDDRYAARVEGQTITIETPAAGSLTPRLSDALLPVSW